MQFAMMAAAQWNGELVTHLAGQCAALRKTQVMRIRRKPTAHKARTGCDQPARGRDRESAGVPAARVRPCRWLPGGKDLLIRQTVNLPLTWETPVVGPHLLPGCSAPAARKAVNCASFASNTASTCAASDARKRLFSGSLWRTHSAASSGERRRLISETSCSRSLADACNPRIASACFGAGFLFRPTVTVALDGMLLAGRAPTAHATGHHRSPLASRVRSR